MNGPGTYRAFADFKPAGAAPLTLGIDTAVPGEVTPRPLAAPANTASVDGYTVTLHGQLVAGRTGKLTLTVSRDGEPVTDLQPYLAPTRRQGPHRGVHRHQRPPPALRPHTTRKEGK